MPVDEDNIPHRRSKQSSIIIFSLTADLSSAYFVYPFDLLVLVMVKV